jgi:hypothetical protein
MSRTTTIVLLVILGVLGLYYFLVQLPKDRAEAQITPTAGSVFNYVWDVSADEVNSLRLEDAAGGRALALARDAAGTWTVEAPEAGAADQAAVTQAVANIANLSVNSTVTATTDLAPFGVLDPAYRLDVGLADGRHLKAAVGDETPTGTGYYLLREGEANVVVVSNFGLDSLIGMLDAPPFAPTATPAAAPAGSPSPEAQTTP